MRRCLSATAHAWFHTRSIWDASRQIEAERRVDHEVAAFGRVTYTAPQASMHIRHLVSVRDRAELASIEAKPVANHPLVDSAIVTVAGIQRDFVRAARVAHQRRPVAS